jgi:hypothetical protein
MARTTKKRRRTGHLAMWRVFINIGSMNSDYRTVLAASASGAYDKAVDLFSVDDPSFRTQDIHKIEMLGRED